MQLQEAFFDIDQRQRRAPIWVVTKKFDKFDRDLKADIESHSDFFLGWRWRKTETLIDLAE